MRGLATFVLGDVSAASDATSLLQKGAVVRGAGLATEVADGVTLDGGDARLPFPCGHATAPRRWREAGRDRLADAGRACLRPAAGSIRRIEERRDYMRRMLGSEDFYWYMLEAGEGTGRPVTEADLAGFGILTAE